MKHAWVMVLGGVVALSGAAADPTTMPAMGPTMGPVAGPAVPSELSALKGRPDAEPTTQPVLGLPFTSQAAGISLRPPAGVKSITRAGGESIVEFVNNEKKISLKVTRTALSKPLKLTIPADAPGPTINGEKDKGLLEITVDQLVRSLPNSKVLRQDVMPLADHNAGIILLRGTVGVQPQLIQQAIIQVNEQLYYNIIYATPGQPFDAPVDKPDATELAATNMFRAVLDSVQILDQEKLRIDQEDRLFRTRSLFVNWNEAKLRSVLMAEQWLRVQRDGKDIGYSYIVEETETRGTTPGVKIGIRARTVPEAGRQVDGETWYHVSFDRKIENWSSIALFTGGDEKYYSTEFGSSVQRRKPVVDHNEVAAEKREKGENVGVKMVDIYSLTVHRVAKKTTKPEIERELPPFYLAQGLGHLMPRLMPIKEPQKYLFASYSSADEEVKLRYVDVGAETSVRLGGAKLQAVPITDRFGYDGTPTIHYLDLAGGKYLGSVTTFLNEDGVSSTVTVLPSDKATLQGIWTNATLTRPDENPTPHQ